MNKLLSTALVTSLIVASIPASAGDNHYHAQWHHQSHGCWSCGRLGPGAAVALGLGAFGIGAALASPWWYAQPTFVGPVIVPTCWNGWTWIRC